MKRNIKGFGGDPSNVMIIGESAGAGSVSMHLTMPKSFGYGSTNSKNKRRQPRLLSSSRKGEYRLFLSAALTCGLTFVLLSDFYNFN